MENVSPVPNEARIVIQEVRDVQVLPDARVVATVIGDSLNNAEPAGPAYFIFVRSGDRFLIDDIVRDQPPATPTP